MRYLMFIRRDESIAFSREDQAKIGHEVETWVAEAGGMRLEGHVLGPISQAVDIHSRDGEATVTEGPPTKSTEFIAGFNILDCSDLDEAIALASKHPMTRFGTVQLRAYVA